MSEIEAMNLISPSPKLFLLSERINMKIVTATTTTKTALNSDLKSDSINARSMINNKSNPNSGNVSKLGNLCQRKSMSDNASPMVRKMIQATISIVSSITSRGIDTNGIKNSSSSSKSFDILLPQFLHFPFKIKKERSGILSFQGNLVKQVSHRERPLRDNSTGIRIFSIPTNEPRTGPIMKLKTIGTKIRLFTSTPSLQLIYRHKRILISPYNYIFPFELEHKERPLDES